MRKGESYYPLCIYIGFTWYDMYYEILDMIIRYLNCQIIQYRKHAWRLVGTRLHILYYKLHERAWYTEI